MESKIISLAYLLVLMCSFSAQQVASIPIGVSSDKPTQGSNQSQQAQEESSLVTVSTASGTLQGTKQPLKTGNSSVYKFLSVPYAEAPLGSLRFQRPVELKQDRSSMLIDASKYGKTCPQYRHLTRFISPLLNVDEEHQTSEDCLHLHVYVPSSVVDSAKADNSQLEPNKQLPVIVWIPGEGFDFADARQFDGSYLAHKTQSIVVSVQYRVGVLGFLYAPKMNIMGNMGIHDQIMALKWVKKNINAFGGDSDRVTLMGRFSGSMSISAMITAPKQDLIELNGQTLFNRVAMLSGVAVNDWIIDGHQEERVEALEKAALNKGYCTETQVKDNACLGELSVENLLRIASFGWRLVADNELIKEQVSPIDAIKLNQFSSHLEGVLIGETGMEGTLCLYRHMLDTNNNYARLIEEDKLTDDAMYDMIKDDSKTYFQYNVDHNKTNPILESLKALINDNDAGETNTHMAREKTDIQANSELSSRLRDKYLNACSSYMVKAHSNRFKRNIMIRNHLADNLMDPSKKPVQVYHYELKYKPSFSLAPDYIKTAAHGDDVPLIFGLVYSQPKKTINEADLLMTRKMMSYIGNFVHGNNPLLHQQDLIKSLGNDNETISMDEDELSSGDNSGNNQVPASSVRSSWSNEGKIDIIELNESDLHELNSVSAMRKGQKQGSSSNQVVGNNEGLYNSNESSLSTKEPRIYLRGDRSNIRVIVVESPQPDLRAQQSILDIIEQRNQQQQQVEANLNPQDVITKSQRLLELHRQQLLEDNFWIQNSKRNPSMAALSNQQQPLAQQATMTLVNESSFLTMLIFSSACIVIFTLMSLCLGLCLVIFRTNLTLNNKGAQHYAGSSSSCNICDDSQGGSIDAVLGKHKKDGRGFSNVFAKLRNHQAQNHPQCTSSSDTNQKGNSNEQMPVLNSQQQVDNVLNSSQPQQVKQQESR